jgi:4-hydroxy-4-methyl-2-oxoglutarate aldolase
MSSADDAGRGFSPAVGDERLTSAILSDSLDVVGLRNQVLKCRLESLVAGSRAFGRAVTVQFAPSLDADPEDPYRDAIDFIDSIKVGEVVVIATDESNESAFWGELFSAAAIGAGAIGVVTDGNLRDTEKIAGLGFAAFSRSRRPIDYRGRMRIVATNSTVTVAGVVIRPGDLIMADDDGIVVVPRSSESGVLELARQRVSRESTVLKELLAGASLREVWNRYRVL